MYNIGQWKAAGKAPISNTELQFMLLLQAQGSSEQWCYQVRHDFWNGCCDFYNWCEDVFVQVDGQCHWRGMHTSSAEKVQDRDLRCNSSAFFKGVALVRVHEHDLQQPQVVMAAIAIAAAECCVVFTKSYNGNSCCQLTQLLQAVQMYCHVCYDAFGNIICKMCTNYHVLVRLISILPIRVEQTLHGSGAGGELKVHQAIGCCVRGVGRHSHDEVYLAVLLPLHTWKVHHITLRQLLLAAPHTDALVRECTDCHSTSSHHTYCSSTGIEAATDGSSLLSMSRQNC